MEDASSEGSGHNVLMPARAVPALAVLVCSHVKVSDDVFSDNICIVPLIPRWRGFSASQEIWYYACVAAAKHSMQIRVSLECFMRS